MRRKVRCRKGGLWKICGAKSRGICILSRPRDGTVGIPLLAKNARNGAPWSEVTAASAEVPSASLRAGSSSGGLRLARGTPLPQDDKSKLLSQAREMWHPTEIPCKAEGSAMGLGILRLCATARGARRRAPLRMTNRSVIPQTWAPGAGRRWGRGGDGGWRRLRLEPSAIRARCGGRRCAGCSSAGRAD